MALGAQTTPSFFGDAPLMRRVAGNALTPQCLQMDGMLAAAHGSLMAPGAGGLRLLFGIMDLVAGVAFERLMRPGGARRLCQGRFFGVALDTFLISRHQPAGPEIVAVAAGHVLHFREHVFRVGVAIHAEFLLRVELVQFDGMAGGALDVFLEPVQGMAFGPGHFNDFLVARQVAGHAHGAGHDDLIVRPFRYLSGTLENGLNEHHVFFVQGGVVAGVAVDALVYAGLPAVKGILHQMAIQAELGIVLGVVVEVQGPGPHDHHQQSSQQADDDFVFLGATVV